MTRQDHSGGNYRPGQWSHAGFVDSGNKVKSLIPEIDFETQEVVQALAFSAILTPAFADLFRQVMRTLTAVAFESFDQTFGDGTRSIHEPLFQFGD